MARHAAGKLCRRGNNAARPTVEMNFATAFKGQALEVKSSDVANDAFLNDGLYVRGIDYFDGKPAIPEATAILTGVK